MIIGCRLPHFSLFINLFSGKYSDQWNRGGAFAEAARIGAEIARTTALPSNGKVAFVPAIAGAAVAPEVAAGVVALGTAATAATVKLAQDIYDRFFAEGEEVQPGKDHPYNPGVPTKKDEFVPPKNWDGKKAQTRGGQYGYPDKRGNVWVSTNPGNAHGGSHWDVQYSNGSLTNVYPK
ncbi:polymorphic toxin type 37 domain-containing protein [Desulforamulus aeronauticus]|uniref:polymorphic toxin type 37 domain-containing protein n=1 Tax=Desulforamulus aeronauticus TaxID=53343 RepID=UPI001114CF22